MQNKFVSILAIILGLIVLACPLLGTIGTSTLIGLSIFLISIFLLATGVNMLGFNKSGAIINIIFGILLLILSIGLLSNFALLSFLTGFSIYIAGIALIIAGILSVFSNDARLGLFSGVIGILLGLIYMGVAAFVANPIFHGYLIGLWLIIAGIFSLVE